MDNAEKERIIKEALMQIKEWQNAMSITDGSYQHPPLRVNTGPVVRDYSLAQVQLTDGNVIGMTITANPTIGAHLTKEMGSTGYLYLYNEAESLMIKADRVVAVKLTKLTKE